VSAFPQRIAPFWDEKRVSNGFLIQALSNHFQAEVIAGLDDREGNHVYNAAFHFLPQTRECAQKNLHSSSRQINRYHKQILIPLGEYIPFQEWKWLSDFSAETFGIASSFSPGNEVKIFSGIVPVGVFICLEEAYSQFVREIRRQGAELFVNLTNDVWFPESRFPWHHFDHGRLRAVENGVCLLRATNTGVTAAIDCFGEPIAIFPPSEKNGGILAVNIATRSCSTIYTFLGDIPILVFSGFFLTLFILERMLRKKKLL
jgi:apolipoprotein N-acyltransferase